MLAFVVISFPCVQFVLKGMKGTSYSDDTWPAWELHFRRQLHNLYCHFHHLTACNTSSCPNSPVLKFHCNVKNKQSKENPTLEGKIPGLWYWFFRSPKGGKTTLPKKKPHNCFKWQMATSLNILQAWTKEDLGCNVIHFPLSFGRLCLNLGHKESLNLQEAGIPTMKSEPTSGKNEWKAQAMEWNRAWGNNTRHLWETLPGYRVLQRTSTAAGTRHNGTHTLVEAFLAI